MSVTHWIIVLVIVLLVFGTSRLKTIGSDLGSAVKGFKKAMEDSETKETKQLLSQKEKDADFHTASEQSTKNEKSEQKS